MTEEDAVAATRAHIQTQFPKICGACGRRFESLRDYLENTSHLGAPVSYDAEVGDFRPLEPLGTLTLATCRCGTSLSISSAGMPLLTVWRLLAWARREARRRDVGLSEVIARVRARIDAEALREPATVMARREPAAQLAAWRTRLAILYLNATILVFPAVLFVWLMFREAPWSSAPLPFLIGIWASFTAVRVFVPERALGIAGLGTVLLSAIFATAVLGLSPGPTIIWFSAVVLATSTYGGRIGLGIVVLAVVEYISVGLLIHAGALPTPPLQFVDAAQIANWFRVAGFFGLYLAIMVVGLANLSHRLESAWREEQAAAKRERRAEAERLRADEARRAVEAAAQKAQRLEAVGRLAGGVAHDFNNLLLVIQSWADIVAEDPDRRAEGIGQIQRATTQATQLTRRLLTFAPRATEAPPRPIDLDTTISSFVPTLKRLLPTTIRLVHVRTVTPAVLLDEVALGQILVNLALNAVDAIPSGGDLTVRADVVPAKDLPPVATDPTADHVVVRVSDDGVGMDEATRARVFEPFFTTKSSGTGTGLGLASVYGIVQQAGGWAAVESTPGKGTMFSLGFPVHSQHDSVTTPPAAADSGDEVLLAEDDDQVREIFASTLRRAGHRVTTARDGDEAIATLRRFKGEFDLLVTDGVMPGAPTSKVVDEFRRMFPRAAVLVCSGHAPATLAGQGLTVAGPSFLQKPFTPVALLGRVDDLLANRAPTGPQR